MIGGLCDIFSHLSCTVIITPFSVMSSVLFNRMHIWFLYERSLIAVGILIGRGRDGFTPPTLVKRMFLSLIVHLLRAPYSVCLNYSLVGIVYQLFFPLKLEQDGYFLFVIWLLELDSNQQDPFGLRINSPLHYHSAHPGINF